jgi:type I restriction enzyme S subunit
LQRGHDLTDKARRPGIVPVMGAAGENGFHDKALVKAPGIVIGRSGGSFGKVHLSKKDFWPHNTALYVSNFKGNDPYFAYYLLRALDFDQLNSGSAQPSLNRNYVYPVRIRVPQPPEQKRIAKVLFTLDAKIELNQRINQELEGMAKSLYDYWFVQFDFPLTAAQATAMGKFNLEGKPYRASGGKMVYNEALKREIPEGWDAVSLASLTPTVNETIDPSTRPTQRFKLYSIPIYDSTGTYSIVAGADIGSNKFVVSENDLLVSKLNPRFSRVIFAGAEADMICSTEFVVWQTKQNWMKDFLYMVAIDPRFIGHCTQSATGTSNSHKRVNPDVMMSFLIPFKAGIAESFSQRVHSILEAQRINRLQSKTLSDIRDWLLPMLMNGQVTVS